MINVNKKLRLCVIANFILLLLIIIIFKLCGKGKSDYWNFGPNDKLVIINIEINTYFKYIILLIMIAILKMMNVVISEIANPIIGFNIYNPDKKIITEFTKNELQLYGNTMYLIDAVRNVLMVMVSISQIDVALFGVIISEFTSIFTIRMLLNEKKFTKDYNTIDTNDELLEIIY